ncbi:hypothetical protein GCM10029978_036790 [Actinoallomurus acanthiterrae]
MQSDLIILALSEYWADVCRIVGVTRAAELRDLADRMAEAPSAFDVRVLRRDLIDRLIQWLPVEHPVRQAIRTHGDRAAGTTTLDWDTAFERLRAALHPAVRSAADARTALLAEPGHTPEELRSEGGDPEVPGLIRLPDPLRGTVLPAFQFSSRWAPHDVVLTVNRLLSADADPWGVADWWLRDNAWLDGRPALLIGDVDDDDLIAAAQAVMEDD